MDGKLGRRSPPQDGLEEHGGGPRRRRRGGAPFLRVSYPRGSASPTVHKETGTDRRCEFLRPPRDEALRLAPLEVFRPVPRGVRLRQRGKLPGLFGGTAINGRHIPDGEDGLSTRYMWRKHGDGEIYAYLPTSTEHGTSLGRGTFRLRPGRWYSLEQGVELNVPGKNDGRIRVWVDGKLMLDVGGLVFRDDEALKIEGIFFSTFFGGGDPTWATPKATHADFARFVSGRYIGP
ncbi:MAG: polysaccharide lyase [Singulisphaera sp.]